MDFRRQVVCNVSKGTNIHQCNYFVSVGIWCCWCHRWQLCYHTWGKSLYMYVNVTIVHSRSCDLVPTMGKHSLEQQPLLMILSQLSRSSYNCVQLFALILGCFGWKLIWKRYYMHNSLSFESEIHSTLHMFAQVHINEGNYKNLGVGVLGNSLKIIRSRDSTNSVQFNVVQDNR